MWGRLCHAPRRCRDSCLQGGYGGGRLRQHRRRVVTSSLQCPWYHKKNGTHMKPEGPVPKGMKWDYHLGEWVLTAAAQRAAERAAERAAKPAAKPAAKKPASRKRADIPEAPLSEYELERRARIDRASRCPRVDRLSSRK